MKAIALFLLILVSGGAVFLLIREPEMKSEEVDEINHSLMATLDPHLGYTHNLDLKSIPNPKKFHFHFSDPDYTFLNNGFVKMNYEENSNPLIIGILGSSETDPFLFDGNWPLLFHKKLKEMKIPHIIYNGAVSGYNSYQVFTKFSRDLMHLDKIKHLIIYHGATECPMTGDSIFNYRNIHPRQLLTLQHVRKFSNEMDRPLWERFKTLLLNQKYTVQLGVQENDFVKNYMMNMNFINAIAKDNKINFLHVQIIHPESAGQFINDSDIVPPDEEFTKSFVGCLKDLNRNLSKLSYSKSFQDKIKPQDPYFYDPMHLTPAGNKFLVDEIIRELILIPPQ